MEIFGSRKTVNLLTVPHFFFTKRKFLTMEMIDLAKEAYRCSNFDLALGIYDKLLHKYGPKMEWLVGKGSSLAQQNRFNEAVNAFYYAQRIGDLQPDSLSHLVDAVIRYISSHSKKTIHKLKTLDVDDKALSCGLCYGILFEPTTLPCGHSFCKDCIQIEQNVRTCQICNAQHKGLTPSKLCVNVVLSQLMSKFFPDQTKGRLLKREGNKLFQEGKYDEAIAKYTEAITLEPNDHLSLSNRSHVYAAQGNYTEALKDADKVCCLKPYWPKGYYRKGAALQGLHHYEVALHAYLQCATLDPTITPARNVLCEVMHKLLTHTHGTYAKRADKSQSLFTISLERDPGVPLNIFTAGLSQLISLVIKSFQDCLEIEEESKRKLSEKREEEERLGQGAKTVKGQSSDESKMEVQVEESNIKEGAKTRNSCGTTTTTTLREIDPELVNPVDLECSLCYRLFFHPVTTPCGHSFCRSCLYRCLDYGRECPLCKGCLSFFLSERYQEETHTLGHILRKYLPDAFHERESKHYAELRELSCSVQSERSEIPIFVCTQAFPKVPCPLHVFEPRYRLMIRQCVESGSRQFGMCTPSNNSFSDVGIILQIREVRHLPDGRAIVDTLGGRRFKVLERGMRDGYHTAKYELIQDNAEEGDEYARLVLLNNRVYEKAQRWFQNLMLIHRIRIEEHFGAFPANEAALQESPDGPDWLWWILAILPLDGPTQGLIVGKNSLKQRLLDIQRILNRITSPDS